MLEQLYLVLPWIYYMWAHRQYAGIDVVRGIVNTSSSNL